MWRAIALMWIGALVEPPIAELATMAFSNALRVRMSEGYVEQAVRVIDLIERVKADPDAVAHVVDAIRYYEAEVLQNPTYRGRGPGS